MVHLLKSRRRQAAPTFSAMFARHRASDIEPEAFRDPRFSLRFVEIFGLFDGVKLKSDFGGG